MEKYKLILGKDCAYTIPKENIVMIALHKALENGITHGNIHDDKTAREYLENIGIKVIEENE